MTRTVDDVEVGCNINKPPMEVYHSGLQELSGKFKRVCPACGVGVLLVVRDPDTFRVMRLGDRCTLCGQKFKYLDDEIGGEPLA